MNDTKSSIDLVTNFVKHYTSLQKNDWKSPFIDLIPSGLINVI
jgi:hypothetical protein